MSEEKQTNPKAIYTGTINIGESQIPCAVLDDGRRVLSETGITESLGARTGSAKLRKKEIMESGGAPMPLFLSPKGLKPFISGELEEGLLNPVEYMQGSRRVTGYEASMLPKVCDVWLKARDAGALHPQQEGKALKADILMRGLAHIGIIALVDEATGYQEIRDKVALSAILDKFLRKELSAWAKRFPDDFYKEMFRLKQWPWSDLSVKRPGVVGKYTNDIVYERLAPGILAELEQKNPKNESGNRVNRHHQWLSDDMGSPALAQHLHAVIGLMRASSDWEQFKRMLNKSFPKRGNTLEMFAE